MRSKDTVFHILAAAPNIGGLGVTVPTLAARTSDMGFRSIILSGPSDIVPCEGYLHRQETASEVWRSISRVEGEGTIVHIHSLWRAVTLAAAFKANRLKIPYMVSPRGALLPAALQKSRLRKKLFWPLQRAVLSEANCLHATSTDELSSFVDLGFKVPIALIPNGVDVPNEVRSPQGKRTLLFLGRINPHKNVHVLVDAWREVASEFPDWTLRIVGPKDDEYISKMRIRPDERIDVSGPAFGQQRSDEYFSADCYILPTKSENFGMTIAEALAHGRPVITTQGAPWSGLKRNSCGWWIPHGKEALADAMRAAMCLTRSELNEMGERGRSWVSRDISWDSSARQHAAVYKWLLGDRQAPESVWFPADNMS